MLEDRVNVRHFFRSGDPVPPQLIFETLGTLSTERHLCAYGVALDDLIATDLSDAGAQLQVSVVLALIASDRLKDVGFRDRHGLFDSRSTG
ncbi:MAG TPA: hypothetical protein VF858_01655 [Gemmatimonadaceae bacterium]